MDFVDENSDQRRIFKVFAICSPFILRHRFGNKKCLNNPSNSELFTERRNKKVHCDKTLVGRKRWNSRTNPKHSPNKCQKLASQTSKNASAMLEASTSINYFSTNLPTNAIKISSQDDGKYSRWTFEHGKEGITMVNDSNSDENEVYVGHMLKVELQSGHGLAIRDNTGSSDPYVRVIYDLKTVYKSAIIFRNLNPCWREEFSFLVNNFAEKEITFKVFDYDRFMKDDFMGSGSVVLATLVPFRREELELSLIDPTDDGSSGLGVLKIALTLTPISDAQRQQFLDKSTRGIFSFSTAHKKVPRRGSTSVASKSVNIFLVKITMNKRFSREFEFFVKIKLQDEEVKSKAVLGRGELKWMEQLSLAFSDKNQSVEVALCTGQLVIGRCHIELASLSTDIERIEDRSYELISDSGNSLGRIFLSISSFERFPNEILAKNEDEIKLNDEKNKSEIAQRYELGRTFSWNMEDIGYLIITVHRAENLPSADLNGLSDPFCILELVNTTFQTVTIYKNINPVWEQQFAFFVKDMYEVLEITVFDEDPNRIEFLGKLVIPLLEINNGKCCWYSLKDQKMKSILPNRSRILLTINFNFNYLKAVLQTFKVREERLFKGKSRFKRTKFISNINRFGEFAEKFVHAQQFVCSCLNWDSYARSISAFIVFTLFIFFIEAWHLPLGFFGIFINSLWSIWKHRNGDRTKENCKCGKIIESLKTIDESEVYKSPNNESHTQRRNSSFSNDEYKLKQCSLYSISHPNGSISLKSKLLAIQDILILIQTKTSFLLELFERIQNLINFTVPILSITAIWTLIFMTILFYFIPLRWIVFCWGIHKFTKRWRKPIGTRSSNELLNLLSRVPSKNELKSYKTIKQFNSTF